MFLFNNHKNNIDRILKLILKQGYSIIINIDKYGDYSVTIRAEHTVCDKKGKDLLNVLKSLYCDYLNMKNTLM